MSESGKRKEPFGPWAFSQQPVAITVPSGFYMQLCSCSEGQSVFGVLFFCICIADLARKSEEELFSSFPCAPGRMEVLFAGPNALQAPPGARAPPPKRSQFRSRAAGHVPCAMDHHGDANWRDKTGLVRQGAHCTNWKGQWYLQWLLHTWLSALKSL
jgi:hypothetical protein